MEGFHIHKHQAFFHQTKHPTNDWHHRKNLVVSLSWETYIAWQCYRGTIPFPWANGTCTMGCEQPQTVPVLLLPMGVPEEGICSQVRARRKVCAGTGLPVVQTQVKGKEKRVLQLTMQPLTNAITVRWKVLWTGPILQVRSEKRESKKEGFPTLISVKHCVKLQLSWDLQVSEANKKFCSDMHRKAEWPFAILFNPFYAQFCQEKQMRFTFPVLNTIFC